jgi:glucose/arabinose dehydrogenase
MGNYYYAYSGGPIVLFRYTYSATGDSLYNEMQILSWTHPGEHCGGRLTTGIDGYLYCTTAEYFFSSDTVGNINGRVLRINFDGTVPVANISGNYPISKGHRNPQGIVQVPNGNILVSEFGASIDELNLILEYQNYGWPAYDGNNCFNIDSCNSPTFNPIPPIDTAMRPPSGITWYDHPAIPEFQGCILQCILSFGGVQGGLVASKLNATMDDVVSDIHYFKGEYKRWRDVTVSPDGKVFAITHDRMAPVIRVIYNPNYHTGVEEYSGSSFLVFPNPSENILTIKSGGDVCYSKIVSLDGKIVRNEIPISNSNIIDISTLSPGMYYLVTNLGTEKFIKK